MDYTGTRDLNPNPDIRTRQEKTFDAIKHGAHRAGKAAYFVGKHTGKALYHTGRVVGKGLLYTASVPAV